MRIQKTSKERATVWFSRDELSFMIAATERALGEMDPDEFDTRTSRTVSYANAVLAQLRVANGEKELPHLRKVDERAHGNSKEIDTSRRLRVTIRVELVADDKALVSLSRTMSYAS